MKRIHELTPKQQLFASEHHNLVYKFLHTKELSTEEYYDVVIFGYLLAVQEYLEKPELSRFAFSTVAWTKMMDCVVNEWIYRSRPKRRAYVESLQDETVSGSLDNLFPNRRQSMAEALDNQELAIRMLSHLTPKEKEIVHLKAKGYTYREIADCCKITVYSVNSRFYRLRKRIKELELL